MNNTKKIVIIGHFGVGKSSLIRRFVQNTFSDEYFVTIGVHIVKKIISLDNNDFTFVIWDIEGKENIQTVRPSYLLGASGFVYVVDLTRYQTYDNINQEINFIEKNYPATPILTIANKSDLIDLKKMKSEFLSKKIAIDYYSSAKTGENVEEMFMALAKKINKK